MNTTSNTTIEKAARMMNVAGAQFSATLALIDVIRAFDDAGLETFEDDRLPPGRRHGQGR